MNTEKEYFVELWSDCPEARLIKRYGPHCKRKAEKLEQALDNRIDHEFYRCHVADAEGNFE